MTTFTIENNGFKVPLKKFIKDAEYFILAKDDIDEDKMDEILEIFDETVDHIHSNEYRNDEFCLRKILLITSLIIDKLESKDAYEYYANAIIKRDENTENLLSLSRLNIIFELLFVSFPNVPSGSLYDFFYAMIQQPFINGMLNINTDWVIYHIYNDGDEESWPVPTYNDDYKNVKKTLTTFGVKYKDIKTVTVPKYGKFMFIENITPESMMLLKLSKEDNHIYYTKQDFEVDRDFIRKDLNLKFIQ